MLHDLNQVRRYQIAATDGPIGKVDDFYFDDRSWRIRYLVISTGWLFGRDVLLAPEAIQSIVPNKREFSVSATRDKIKDAPGIATDLPVSKQAQTKLHRHYGWTPRWDVDPVGAGPLIPPLPPLGPMPRAAESSIEAAAEEEAEEADPHLRSVREVEGYDIAAKDGEIGHVEDFVIDDETWLIRYLVVDTRNWLPGRKVVVAPNWAVGISWSEGIVQIDLTRAAIRHGPEYDPAVPIDRQYETLLHERLGQVGYWE